jgi:hypothetical protein
MRYKETLKKQILSFSFFQSSIFAIVAPEMYVVQNDALDDLPHVEDHTSQEEDVHPDEPLLLWKQKQRSVERVVLTVFVKHALVLDALTLIHISSLLLFLYLLQWQQQYHLDTFLE